MALYVKHTVRIGTAQVLSADFLSKFRLANYCDGHNAHTRPEATGCQDRSTRNQPLCFKGVDFRGEITNKRVGERYYLSVAKKTE